MQKPLSLHFNYSRTKTSSLKKTSFLFVLSSIFILFMVNLFFNLERTLFLNELFSFFGLFLFFKNAGHFLNIKKQPVLIAINFLLLYCLISAIFGLFFTSYLYGYLRTLTFFYSIFCFFLGAEFIKKYKYLLSSGLWDKVIIPLTATMVLFGSSIAYPIILPVLLRKYRYWFILTLTVLVIIATCTRELTSDVMCFIFVLAFIIIKDKNFKQLFFHPLFIAFLIFFFYIAVFFSYYYFYAFYNFGYKVMPHFMNNNTIWRLMFWAYELNKQLASHPLFGIGFGTPFFDAADPQTWFLTNNQYKYDPDFPYTLGAHNFLIYFIVRLGIIGIIPIIAIYLIIFNHLRLHPFSPLTKTCFFGFLLITVLALCNVVISTPLYAGTYWILLGMLFQSFERDRKDNENKNYLPHTNAAT